MSAKNWCFTFNNPPADHETEDLYDNHNAQVRVHVEHLIAEHKITYCVWQYEQGAAGTNHVQGYCQFGTRTRLNQAQEMFGVTLRNAHWEKAKGTAKQASDYCKKLDTRVQGPYELGILKSAGKRTDLDLFVQAMKEKVLTTDEIFDQFPSIQAKYPRFTKDLQRRARRIEPPIFTPRVGWQTDLVSYLHSPTNNRQVRWYFDETGNSGKSYTAMSYGHGLGYVVTGGKHADIFYAYDHQPVVFFDWPRSAQETFPYGVTEAFKNGYFLSTKYESAPIRFPVPHVIVFANFRPDQIQLSADRWDIIVI